LVKSMRKVRTGSVVRVSMDRTAVVEMVWKQRNRLYRKQVRRLARFMVHDPKRPGPFPNPSIGACWRFCRAARWPMSVR